MRAVETSKFFGNQVWALFQGKHCLGWAYETPEGVEVIVEGEELGIASDINDAIEKGENFMKELPYFCDKCGYNCKCTIH